MNSHSVSLLADNDLNKRFNIPGYPKKKDDPTKWRKIPVEVHKCYRSTSTGVVTKRGGTNALKSPVFIINATLLLGAVCYFVWFFFGQSDNQASKPISETEIKYLSQENGKSNIQNNSVPDNTNPNKVGSKGNVSLELPYSSQQVFYNGHQTVELNKQKKYREYFFTFILNGRELSMSSDRLASFGLRVSYINDCAVKIYNSKSEMTVYCQPVFNNDSPIEREPLLSQTNSA